MRSQKKIQPTFLFGIWKLDLAVVVGGGQIGDRRLFATRLATDRSEAFAARGERDNAKVAAFCRGGFVARGGKVLLSPARDVAAVVHRLCRWKVQMADGVDDRLEVVVAERFRVQAVPEREIETELTCVNVYASSRL